MRRLSSSTANRGRLVAVAVILLTATGCVPVPNPPAGSATSTTTATDASRAAAARLWTTEYLSSVGVASEWTGSVPSCASGSLSAAYRAAVLRRINYFRAMAGLPGVQLDAAYSAKAGEAALIMAANNLLSHDPPTSWLCYSVAGADGAAHSNLALGVAGPQAIDGYIEDGGTTNAAVGHRRWLLHPPTTRMGLGDVPGQSNALWVIDGTSSVVPPRDGYVAWPPKGYVPSSLVFPRWSFAVRGADLTAATVSMARNGKACALTVVHRDRSQGTYGDPAVVWQVDSSCRAGTGGDVVYRVTVSGVVVAGASRSYSYTVTAFTP